VRLPGKRIIVLMPRAIQIEFEFVFFGHIPIPSMGRSGPHVEHNRHPVPETRLLRSTPIIRDRTS
jgi:hypothetical protein